MQMISDFSLEVLQETGNLTLNYFSHVMQVQMHKHRSVANTITLTDSALICKSDSVLPTSTYPNTGAQVQVLWGKSCSRTRLLFHVSFWPKANIQLHS